MDQEIQIINGKLYTKPAEPQEISSETVKGWLAEAQQNLDNARISKENSITSQDATIELWNTKVSKIEALLAELEG